MPNRVRAYFGVKKGKPAEAPPPDPGGDAPSPAPRVDVKAAVLAYVSAVFPQLNAPPEEGGWARRRGGSPSLTSYDRADGVLIALYTRAQAIERALLADGPGMAAVFAAAAAGAAPEGSDEQGVAVMTQLHSEALTGELASTGFAPRHAPTTPPPASPKRGGGRRKQPEPPPELQPWVRLYTRVRADITLSVREGVLATHGGAYRG